MDDRGRDTSGPRATRLHLEPGRQQPVPESARFQRHHGGQIWPRTGGLRRWLHRDVRERSHGKWADEGCSLFLTAHNSGPGVVTTKAAASSAMVTPRAASKAIKTAINTGTKLRIL